MRANTRKQGANPARLILLAALVLAAMLLAGCAKAEVVVPDEPEPEQNNNVGFRIGYAADAVTAVDDVTQAQMAVDEMYRQATAGEGSVSFSYKNTATSTDGKTFECYIANANTKDIFISIYGDAEFTDELFLSQLLKPGQAFETVTLNHALEPGKHQVFVTNYLVEEQDGEQVLTGEATVTMDFVVQ